MSDDDDWFERAFADSDDDSEAATADGETEAGRDDTARPDAGTDTEETAADDGSDGATDGFERAFGADPDDDAFGFDVGAPSDDAESTADQPDVGQTDPGQADATDPFGGVRDRRADERRGTDAGADSDGHDPFPDDFAAAMESAPEFGGPSDDFAAAMESAPGLDGPDAGFGGMGGDAETFDDEAFESDIERLDIGIDGLDEMILGGVPTRSLMVAIGSAGTGKTTFGLQFLNRALEDGEKAVYITLEESRQRIFDTAEEKGWAFREYAEEDRLAVIDLDPVEMANSLASIQNDLPRLVSEFGAQRLVLDSVSLLEMMYDRPSERRSQVFDFARALKDAGVTTLLTSEAKENNPYSSRHGLVEYLADAVFVLQYVRPSDFRETRLAIEIQKVRDANHSRETKPYELTNDGISVYRQANIF
ncbi:reca-superfamily ATPase possibly involved in signal transduction [Halogeometricum pallidum JCM 14848]|uniref:Reca-superfamily ATPase possibly involved in signal transduction n=1 Tax=Halogeometricum pallidum JCM 14848 TaxID=1227487 RepID=M0DD74_HALPD|nr:KaiC domain-containing protein [Halogeometricum pallidum]ELZ33420.1 reca-superfamily ATPase possibly involved in signal transduction [Halogeometricum pallidum JCM 14848]